MMKFTDKNFVDMVIEDMNNLALIGCFSQIQERNLQERFHKLNVKLEDVKYCVCEYSQNLESSRGYTGEDAMHPKDNNDSRQKQGCLAQEDVNESNQGLQGTIEIDYVMEELWNLMMGQSKWRKMTAERMINKNLKLIGGRKMNQKAADMQQQQRCRALGQLQTKVRVPGGFYQHMKSHDREIMNVFNLGSLMREHPTFQILYIWQRSKGSFSKVS
jgi:hypothetical protein